jgi:FKBP-type peptidyl-prolyl cis-trans isomerase
MENLIALMLLTIVQTEPTTPTDASDPQVPGATTQPAGMVDEPAPPSQEAAEVREFTTPEGLKIVNLPSEILTARAGDIVAVHYTGTLQNGQVFDTSFRNPQSPEPIVFQLGTGRVIRGWDLGIAGMKPGEKRRLTIPPDLAYGARGTPGGPIGPNATLIFEVELVHVSRQK